MIPAAHKFRGLSIHPTWPAVPIWPSSHCPQAISGIWPSAIQLCTFYTLRSIDIDIDAIYRRPYADRQVVRRPHNLEPAAGNYIRTLRLSSQAADAADEDISGYAISTVLHDGQGGSRRQSSSFGTLATGRSDRASRASQCKQGSISARAGGGTGSHKDSERDVTRALPSPSRPGGPSGRRVAKHPHRLDRLVWVGSGIDIARARATESVLPRWRTPRPRVCARAPRSSQRHGCVPRPRPAGWGGALSHGRRPRAQVVAR